MKKISILILISIPFLFLNFTQENTGPIITNLTYDNITQSGVTVYWQTDSPADSKIKWMLIDSNYQPIIFSDSVYNPSLVTTHSVPVSNLQTAKIYKYQVTSQNTGGIGVDSGYFVTQSSSTGRVSVYFNHSVDTTVSTGEKANGNQNFETLFLHRIDSALYSIDITLFEFRDYPSISTAIVNAKNRGVKVRAVCTSGLSSSMLDTLIANGIPIIVRNYDTAYVMHNKFWIFDHRYNTNPNNKYLWTGSTNISHAMFNDDKNNIIVIQDESLCEVYMREFEEMWGSHTNLPIISRAKFGPQKINNTPHILNVAGTRMEVYYSPSDSITSYMTNLILNKPTKSIFFCIYHFESSEYEDAMHNIFNNGKQIKGVFDLSRATESGCPYSRMKGLQVPNAWNPPADVWIDSSAGLLHHKYLIIDANSAAGNFITVTGSYNWGREFSLDNDENLITVFNPRVTNLYYQEFYKRFRGAGGAVIGINSIGNEIPESYILYQNYPNPFNPSTKIRFSTPLNPPFIKGGTVRSTEGFITLKIYDILGREVATLVNDKLKPGTYEVEFDATNFASGIYFYQLSTEGFRESKKMLLVK